MGLFARLSKKRSAPGAAPTKDEEPVFAPRPREVIDLLPVSVNTKWGFIDRTGRMVIPPQFDGARTFSGGRARVWKDGKVGFIDATGAIVIEPQFAEAFGGFREGRAAVRIDDSWRFVDASGAFVGEGKFEAAHPFREGYAQIRLGGKWGFANIHGEVAVRPDYRVTADFSEGLAGVIEGGKWSFIDSSGTVVLKSNFEEGAGRPIFSEGLVLGRISQGYGSHLAFINRSGKIISGGWKLAAGFSEGLAVVATRDVDPLYGYITREGNYALQHQFSMAWSFSEGRAAIRNASDKWGFIDKTGRMILEPKFDYVLDMDLEFVIGFYSGMAKVKIGERFAYIDMTGRLISYEKIE